LFVGAQGRLTGRVCYRIPLRQTLSTHGNYACLIFVQWLTKRDG
jgi:hypothetical protein